MTSDSGPDDERVQERAEHRQHERAEHVESVLAGTEGLLEEAKYPTTSEELSVEYADQELDLPNETESLGSVFDRLVDERFETPSDAREAVLNEVTGSAGGDEEYNDQRELEELDDLDDLADPDESQDLDRVDDSDERPPTDR